VALALVFLFPFGAAEDGPAVSLVPRPALEACSGAVGTISIAPRLARRR
jgi:hypothetical protein